MLFHAADHLGQLLELVVAGQTLAQLDLATGRRLVTAADSQTPRLRFLSRIVEVLCHFVGLFKETVLSLFLQAREVVVQLFCLLPQPCFFGARLTGEFSRGLFQQLFDLFGQVALLGQILGQVLGIVRLADLLLDDLFLFLRVP